MIPTISPRPFSWRAPCQFRPPPGQFIVPFRLVGAVISHVNTASPHRKAGYPFRKQQAREISRVDTSRPIDSPTDSGADLDYDSIIIGAGMSGLYQLYRLRERGSRVRVRESGTKVGGTGNWNR